MSKKHYSELEKRLFLNILRKYSHVIENKKNNAATLKGKDEAWDKISEEYNNSATISTERSVQQLKKMWSNMKSIQRDNLTKEKQARLATGGGPPPSPADVDPEITDIIPSLMKTVPTVFSSNVSADVLQQRETAILDENSLIEVIIDQEEAETLIPTVIEKVDPLSYSKNTEEVSSKHALILNDTAPRKRMKKSIEVLESKVDVDLKLERINNIMKEERELATLRKEHEKQKQKLELEHLMEVHSREIAILSEKLNHEREKQQLELQFLKMQYEVDGTVHKKTSLLS